MSVMGVACVKLMEMVSASFGEAVVVIAVVGVGRSSAGRAVTAGAGAVTVVAQ